MSNLRRRYASLEFIGICSDPPDVVRTHRIPAFHMSGDRFHVYTVDAPFAAEKSSALRRFLPGRLLTLLDKVRQSFNIFRFVGRIDVLLISGGGQLDDFWGGPWGRPFELLAWSLACRLRGRRVAVFATGVDNLNSKVGTRLSFAAMRLAHYKAYRDQKSLEAARATGMREPGHVCPDPAFSLPIEHLNLRGRPPAGNATRVVVVCPISERAWMQASDRSYAAYRESFVTLCIELLRVGIEVRISNSQINMDMPVVEEMAAAVRSAAEGLASRLLVTPARTVDEYALIAARADVVIASRLHGVILPLVVGTPVIGISYMRKVSQLLSEVGMAEQCVELREVSAQKVVDMTLQLLAQAPAARMKITALNSVLRHQLDQEYAALISAFGVKP